MSRDANLKKVRRLAIGLCNAPNETEQNVYRRELGILLLGWSPDTQTGKYSTPRLSEWRKR